MADETIHNSTRIRLGPFDLLEVCGTGGMGEVWRARHRATGAAAAVKVITTNYAGDASFRTSFQREARAMARLTHPNIVRIYDYGRIDADTSSGDEFIEGGPYVAMEFGPDGTLLDAMQRGLSWNDVRQVLLDVLAGLAYAHARGLLHRDIKPENVLAARDGGERTWKLTDFGIAHSIDALDEDRPDQMAGTPEFMAPEQFSGSWRDFGPPTDLYAVGCMAYQLVYGRVPFVARTPLQIGFKHIDQEPPPLEPIFAVPDGLTAWIQTLLEKDPTVRFQKAADAAIFLDDLADVPVDDRGSTVQAATLSAPTQIDDSAPTIRTPAPPMHTDSEIVGGRRHVGEETKQHTIWAYRRTRRGAAAKRRGETGEAWPSWRTDRARASHKLTGMSPRLFALRDVPLVGRDAERDALWDALRRVATQQRSQGIVLQGVAGSGKSRLARWLCERADELGLAEYVRAAHGPEFSKSHGLGGMLVRWGNLHDLTEDDLRGRLASLLGLEADDSQWLVDDLSHLIEGTSRGDDERQNQMNAVIEVLERAASERPLIVWLDDLQWGESAMELLEAALDEQAPRAPILFLTTVQSEGLAQRPSMKRRLEELRRTGRIGTLEVSFMSRSQTHDLVEELLVLDDDLADRVIHRVDGNPLFAVQLIGDWVSRGWLTPSGDGLRLRDDVRPELPDDLHTVWVERIERVLDENPDIDVRTLYLAALLGSDVHWQEWRAACEQAGRKASPELVEMLAELKLVELHNSGWRFIHGMLRQSLLRMARASGHWRELNDAAARALEKLDPGGDNPGYASKIGPLLLNAGRAEAAAPALLLAANHLKVRGDRIGTFEMLELLNTACERAGLEDSRIHARSLLVRAGALVDGQRFDEAAEVTDRVHEIAMENDWLDVAAESLEERCQIEHRAGRLADSTDYARDALRIFQQIGATERAVRARFRLANDAAYRGRHDEAIEQHRTGLLMAEDLDLAGDQGRCHWGIGYSLHQQLSLDEARTHLERALALFKAEGLSRHWYSVLSGLADVDRLQGNYELAEQRYLRVLEFLESQDASALVVSANLAIVHLLRGDDESATEWTERAEREEDLGFHITALLRLVLDSGDPAAGAWEARFARYEESLDASEYVDIDLATLLELAAQRAYESGLHTRVTLSLELAVELWERLSLTEPAEDARRRLEQIDEG